MDTINDRPNIRIEIQNNLVDPMEVDDQEKLADSDFEDGEISEKNELPDENNVVSSKQIINNNNRTWSNSNGGFTTGVDIFDKKEQEKLVERAHRFGLKPGEISNFTDEHLQQLHISLGITAENEKNVRFEAVHMRGTDEMSTEDVFEYFGKYGPAFVEWINDESCNVVWQDKVSAARALHFISKAIKGMPVEGPCDPFAKEVVFDNESDDKESEKENPNAGRSILLVNKDREVSFEKDDAEASNNTENMDNLEDSVSISDIAIPIPPGYWRLGFEHPKTKCILLRFAFKTDKKPMRAERFSEYYKKHGNPNFGGMKGLISESRRKKFKGIFDRNKEITKKAIVEDNKNPWGDLAENWDLDEQFSERVYEAVNNKNVPSTRSVVNYSSEKPDVMKRLGAKRNLGSDNESSGSQEEHTKKKSKVPRMRMYADEEEEKLKRKKHLLSLKLHQNTADEEPNQVHDLRNIIGTISKNKKSEQYLEQQRTSQVDNNDLGTKLKNRARINEESNVRFKADNMKIVKGDETQSRHSERKTRHRSPSNSTRHSRHRHESPSHKRSSRHDYDRSRYKNRLHSDRYERRRRSLSNDEGVDQCKPKSKVAVVIKTQKRPTVASTIWSRITPKKERLKTASERLQPRKESSSSSESSSESSNSSSSSESSSTESSSDTEDESNDEEVRQPVEHQVLKTVERPGFKNTTQSSLTTANIKSPLRIEINNDHFKEE